MSGKNWFNEQNFPVRAINIYIYIYIYILYLYLWIQIFMNMCTLLNEGEYCSCGIFLENYLKEISWDRI